MGVGGAHQHVVQRNTGGIRYRLLDSFLNQIARTNCIHRHQGQLALARNGDVNSPHIQGMRNTVFLFLDVVALGKTKTDIELIGVDSFNLKKHPSQACHLDETRPRLVRLGRVLAIKKTQKTSTQGTRT